MATVVRCFSYAGAIQARAKGAQKVTDTFMMDDQPYLARQNITCDDAAATDTTAALCPDKVDYVLLQVEPGKRVFYEVNPPGRTLVSADTSSPYIEGDQRVKVSPQTLFSFRDYPIT